MDTQNLNNLNREVKQWSRNVAESFRGNVRNLTNKGKIDILRKRYSPALAENIVPGMKLRDGMAERITFAYPRHGYFISVGSSRGHHHKRNPRTIKDWYTETLDTEVDTLADIVAGHISSQEINIRK